MVVTTMAVILVASATKILHLVAIKMPALMIIQWASLLFVYTIWSFYQNLYHLVGPSSPGPNGWVPPWHPSPTIWKQLCHLPEYSAQCIACHCSMHLESPVWDDNGNKQVDGARSIGTKLLLCWVAIIFCHHSTTITTQFDPVRQWVQVQERCPCCFEKTQSSHMHSMRQSVERANQLVKKVITNTTCYVRSLRPEDQQELKN